jgi:hypothetical protein
MGTAIHKHAGILTQSEQLIPQAISRDRNTFFDTCFPWFALVAGDGCQRSRGLVDSGRPR